MCCTFFSIGKTEQRYKTHLQEYYFEFDVAYFVADKNCKIFMRRQKQLAERSNGLNHLANFVAA